MNEKVIIRKARQQDLEAMLKIYNSEVKTSTATFDIREKTMQEWQQWFEQHNDEIHPVFAAELDGHICGYASLSRYREKEAYKTTVELSVYVDKQYRNIGIADSLMKHIIEYAKCIGGIHCIVSVITAGNEVSAHLHKKHGFSYSGTLHEVGMKFGEYLGTDNYELRI